MRVRIGTLALLLLASTGAFGQSPQLTWEEAVRQLAAERTRAVNCAGIARKRPAAEAEPLARQYAEAKALNDGVIEGLAIALARRAQPVALPDVERRMREAFVAREGFCRAVEPESDEGTKGVLTDILGAVVGPLIEAVVTLYKYERERSDAVRATILARVEAQRWPAFAAVPPAR